MNFTKLIVKLKNNKPWDSCCDFITISCVRGDQDGDFVFCHAERSEVSLR